MLAPARAPCSTSPRRRACAAPYTAGYSAAKAQLLALSEAVHTEVRGRGVTVTAVCPPPVRTELFAKTDHPVEQVPGVAVARCRPGGRRGARRGTARQARRGAKPVARATAPVLRFAPAGWRSRRRLVVQAPSLTATRRVSMSMPRRGGRPRPARPSRSPPSTCAAGPPWPSAGVVEDVRQPVAAARPRLDPNTSPSRVARAELDLAGLEMPVQASRSGTSAASSRSRAPGRPTARASAPRTRRRRASRRLAVHLLETRELGRRHAVRGRRDARSAPRARSAPSRIRASVAAVEQRPGAVGGRTAPPRARRPRATAAGRRPPTGRRAPRGGASASCATCSSSGQRDADRPAGRGARCGSEAGRRHGACLPRPRR